MNWLTNLIPPRIRSFVGEQKEMPDNLWQKCTACEGMLFHRDLEENLNVCYHCGHHLRLSVADRLRGLFDNGQYDKLELPRVELDPLKFKDRKRYADRIKEAQTKTGLKEAITVARGKMGGINVVIAAFNFRYMGGSMGAAVGEAIIKGAETAVKDKAAFIVVPASGGARMQEGMLSLMQMPRTIIAVEMVKEARLPYIVILTDPTTGGVSASFAMVGDIHIAEPGAMIGFAGRRVIEETVREKLPEDFQTAEYLLAHGMVDMVVARKDMKQILVNIIGILMKRKPSTQGGDGQKTEKPHESSGRVAQKFLGSIQNANQSAPLLQVSDAAQSEGVRKRVLLSRSKIKSSDSMREAKQAAKKISSHIQQNARDVTGQKPSKAAA